MLNRIINEESGVLTFEWILLLTVLVIGITGALSAVRDALNTELGDVVEAMIALDQSYYICWPWEVLTPDHVVDGAACSYYKDSANVIQDRYFNENLVPETIGKKPRQTVSQLNDWDPGEFNL